MAVDPIRGAGDPQLRVAGAQTHALFEQHARMIYGLCRALLRDPDDADDATQATFISAYRSLLGGSDVREPAAWLATIARNECASRAQARMREPLPLLDADLGHTQGPEVELERKAVVAELQRAIAGLPDKQREVVVLRDLYGLHYTEVGAALGMSVAAVESLLFRARRSLRISLKPLAGGALTVPIAVREGIAQALPAFTPAGAAGGGAASGAVGLGLFAKLAGGPAAVKAAAGVAAAIAAGSIAVAGVEGVAGPPPAGGRSLALAQATGVGDPRGGAAVASFAAVPAAGGSRETSDGRNEGSGRGKQESSENTRGGHGNREGHEGSDDNRSTDGDRGSDDSTKDGTAGTAAGDGGSEHSSHSGEGDATSGSSRSHGSGAPDADKASPDVLDTETFHSLDSRGQGGDSGSGSESGEADDSGGSGGPGSSESSGHDSGEESGHDEPLPPA